MSQCLLQYHECSWQQTAYSYVPMRAAISWMHWQQTAYSYVPMRAAISWMQLAANSLWLCPTTCCKARTHTAWQQTTYSYVPVCVRRWWCSLSQRERERLTMWWCVLHQGAFPQTAASASPPGLWLPVNMKNSNQSVICQHISLSVTCHHINQSVM